MLSRSKTSLLTVIQELLELTQPYLRNTREHGTRGKHKEKVPDTVPRENMGE